MPERPAQRFGVWLGLIVLGYAIAMSVFIQWISGAPSGMDDVPRAVAVPALYATTAIIAILGARQSRPWVLVAAGVLCVVGARLSIVTVPLAIPGILLFVAAFRVRAIGRSNPSEQVVAIGLVSMVIAAGVALLTTTEGREFASGYNSAALTIRGAAAEAALLLSAIVVVVATDRWRRHMTPS